MDHGTQHRRRLAGWWGRAKASSPGKGPAAIGLIALLASMAYLVKRLAPDVGRIALHPDEAVTGLVSARPLPELISTVLSERGGPPFHFLAAHVSLSIDPSFEALRWTSVAFAVGTVALSYDLGRRIAGHMAGATAAIVAATSTMLGQLGTFGRMYAAFAFVAALAADTFYRALEERTTGAAVLAAFAAVLATATHTYGVFILLAEAVVALYLWRGRPLRAALPVLLVGLLLIPVMLAYLRLSDRFSVKVGEGSSLASPRGAVRQLHNTLAGISGGRQVVFLFALLAILGVVVVLRRQPGFLALWAAVAAPLLLYLLLSGSGAVALAPRHLIYALPLWATLVGAGFAFATGRLPLAVQALLLAVVALIGIQFQSRGAGDPRAAGTFGTATGRPRALAEPVSWLRDQVQPTDVLYQYTVPFLAALDTTGQSVTVGPGPGGLVARGLDRVDYPATAAVIALPIAGAELDRDLLVERLGPDADVLVTPEWLLVRQHGPFHDNGELLSGMAAAFAAAQDSLVTAPPKVEGRLQAPFRAVCSALKRYRDESVDCASAAQARP